MKSDLNEKPNEGGQRVPIDPGSLLRRGQLHSLPRRQGGECDQCLWGGARCWSCWWWPETDVDHILDFWAPVQVGLDHPHLHPLSPYNAPGLTQGYGWITNKSAMNVREVDHNFKCQRGRSPLSTSLHPICRQYPPLSSPQVEFARAYRLTMTSIEPVSFTVPRVKAACFQVQW